MSERARKVSFLKFYAIDLSLPNEVGHVCVRCIDSSKARENCHDRDPYHSHAADELLNGEQT